MIEYKLKIGIRGRDNYNLLCSLTDADCVYWFFNFDLYNLLNTVWEEINK